MLASLVAFICLSPILKSALAEDVVILAAAVSETGKYAQNGAHTKNGYDLAARRVNETGGVEIGGKRYKLTIRYYDDESTPARSSELCRNG